VMQATEGSIKIYSTNVVREDDAQRCP